MSFSTGDVFLIFTLLFFLYASPIIYVLLTIYGTFKKAEHPALIKAIAFANLLITVNLIYYSVTLDDLNDGGSTLQFVSISLAAFSPASISLLVNTQKKCAFYSYTALFFLSFGLYNLYYFPEKIEQDREAMIISSLQQGNIKKLQQTFNEGCPSEQATFYYLRTMAEGEIYPASSFVFLLDCTDKDHESSYSKDNFITYYQNVLQKPNINKKLLDLLLSDYYRYLNNRDKQELVTDLLNRIDNIHSDKENERFTDRLNLLIKHHPELKKFIKVDDQYILQNIDHGNASLISYIKPYYSTQNQELLLATNVLLHEDAAIVRKISRDKHILSTKILSSIGGIWGSRDVDLVSYIFRYGSEDLINWILIHSLDNTAAFDYQEKLFNHASQQEEYYCNNYLIKYTSFNPNLTDAKKQSVRQALIQKSHCQEK
ncbi:MULTISPECIES: hypothetical protein [Klebsiella]|uniref:hypothetical protein n=1 Tax=Klebsiella TaxID=570 RepID=UPI00115800B9|nr:MULTISPECIES: hypothetical protein [Klebsiella]VUS47764.1 hypothetical protein SB6423_05102 [Klebsiella pasteurii]